MTKDPVRTRRLTQAEAAEIERRLRRVTPIELELALAQGDAAVIAQYLYENPQPDPSIVHELARMLDPSSRGHDSLKLVFKARRAGNPVSDLDADLNHARIGLAAESLYQEKLSAGAPKRGLWKWVVYEIAERYGVKERTVQAALQSVRSARANPEE